MPPKHPFMDCKSRKLRKKRIPTTTKSKEKLFCPRTMARYDGLHGDYLTKWVYKMCLNILLSQEAVTNHLANCSGQTRQPSQAPPNNEDTHYICKYCDKVFSRGVKLKKHLEQHEKSSSRLDSELSDIEVEDRPIKTENASEDNYQPED
ncbi:uncharacterized protein LOC132937434 [Metopolophium dirhodum]|uniref:uncharacterized protein LOC132937434 n=1 Tax=Metopolophium dirhodum TaxID=44670 RepID=UPI0029904F49|nr:uncharacterized protein LOC132937434 [Metopolophium dirhodum]